jgi:hypothetical protein
MNRPCLSERLGLLHIEEERLRNEALLMVSVDEKLQMQVSIVEGAMDLAFILRQFETSDEDLKVAQVLGMRTFNAFAASLKLALSGYHQNSALILRDVLETVFLLDLFESDRSLIERWRLADKKTRLKHFRPVKVREALDARDGFATKKRSEIYDLFCDLAGHPTMKSALMMRPQKNGDAVIGPFMAATPFGGVIFEMGRTAIQVGETLERFLPKRWDRILDARFAFAKRKQLWLTTFYQNEGRGGAE